jgi:hypothetical protein
MRTTRDTLRYKMKKFQSATAGPVFLTSQRGPQGHIAGMFELKGDKSHL